MSKVHDREDPEGQGAQAPETPAEAEALTLAELMCIREALVERFGGSRSPLAGRAFAKISWLIAKSK